MAKSKFSDFTVKVKEEDKESTKPKSQLCSSCLGPFEGEGKKSKETYNKKPLYTAQHPECKDEYVRVYFSDPYVEVRSKDID